MGSDAPGFNRPVAGAAERSALRLDVLFGEAAVVARGPP